MTGPTVAVTLAIATALFLIAFWFAPGGVLALRRIAGGELQVDLRPAYGPETLYRLLEAYGPKGRRMFRGMLLADMVFPAIYGAALFTSADLLASAQTHAASATNFARWGAVAAAGFDYLENAFLLHALRHWATRPSWSARLAGLFTTLKMAAFGVTATCLAVSGLAS